MRDIWRIQTVAGVMTYFLDENGERWKSNHPAVGWQFCVVLDTYQKSAALRKACEAFADERGIIYGVDVMLNMEPTDVMRIALECGIEVRTGGDC